MGNFASSNDFSSTSDSDMWAISSEEEAEDYVSGLETSELRAVQRQAAGATATSVSQVDGGVATQKLTTNDQTEQKGWVPKPCGFEAVVNDDEWETWAGPQRIRESKLESYQKDKFREILDRIFHKDTIMGAKIIFEPQDIEHVTGAVLPYLESEPVLIEDVPYDIVIVGDLHGQLYDLDRVFRLYAKDGKPGWECMKFLFLGDYVDRGRQALEVMMALFCIKVLHPDRIFLLRGNHEFIDINANWGFGFDIRERYDKLATACAIFHQFNEAFANLSLAAIVGNSYFCSHSGISLAGFTRRQLRGKYKPIMFSDGDAITNDLMWADPAQGLKGSTFNKEREQSCFFGFDELCLAMERMEVIAVFRGHSMMQEGYGNTWNVCYTVFTATGYDKGTNKGAIAHVDPTGKVHFTVLEINPKRAAFESKLRAVEYISKEDPNVKTTRFDVGSGYIKGGRGGKDAVE
ncbi:hypothetical protein PRIPAC_92649 [Pristionchus pacificus]|uniref:Serine/threonine-protein phosphatase n=1 Tax=Pristionchus pacificus TaxID=54126 RepID=A0A2A6CHL5_PRIPA|nr:hypothetical protein PRIPAC_92649 [Pristionchus pacificus]|eukprot:PDM77692.1 Calcineurin-like phosphoesterase [Pristionchus pacificus]